MTAPAESKLHFFVAALLCCCCVPLLPVSLGSWAGERGFFQIRKEFIKLGREC